MIGTIIYLAVLFGATLFLPFLLQILLYILALFVVKNKFLILVPAIFADVLYAPSDSLSPQNYKTFLIVFGILIIYFFIIKITINREKYDFEKK